MREKVFRDLKNISSQVATARIDHREIVSICDTGIVGGSLIAWFIRSNLVECKDSTRTRVSAKSASYYYIARIMRPADARARFSIRLGPPRRNGARACDGLKKEVPRFYKLTARDGLFGCLGGPHKTLCVLLILCGNPPLVAPYTRARASQKTGKGWGERNRAATMLFYNDTSFASLSYFLCYIIILFFNHPLRYVRNHEKFYCGYGDQILSRERSEKSRSDENWLTK